MLRRLVVCAVVAVVAACSSKDDGGLPFIQDSLRADAGCDWTQWGQNWAHTGGSCVPAQGFGTVLAQITFDPFVPLETTEAANLFNREDLFAHYATPLVQGNDVYVAVKAGTYVPCAGSNNPCGFDAWNSQIWTVEHHVWSGKTLTKSASFASDWKPPAPETVGYWEPVFQHAVRGNVVWIPGAGGTVWRTDGALTGATQVNPFTTFDGNRFLTGPIVVDADGSVLYNVVELAALMPASTDATGWLVKISADGSTKKAVRYQDVVQGAPTATAACPYSFRAGNVPRPWPATSPVPTGPCGSQRPGFNSAPAIGPGGTVFVVSRAHFSPNDSSIVALKVADLSPKWTFRMREILSDGCGVTIPADATSSSTGITRSHCRQGAPTGVDPTTGLKPSVWVDDEASSVPVALPDGAVLYGGLTTYNTARGHLMKVGPDGKLMATYDFGWDVTPAVWVHDGTYSIITKDNHYFSWTSSNEGPFDITQLDRDLKPQWKYTSTQTQSCSTLADGGLSCNSDHPDGFEWCVNAPAVASDGTVYANSEDGRVYAIGQGGTKKEERFLLQSLGAAYTPITVDAVGRVYSMNGGVLTIVGR